MRSRRVYFDYAASTPVDSRVETAMRPYFLSKFGNPVSLHAFGQEAMAGVDGAREKIAKALGIDFREIVFTASATEANNLALRGSVNLALKRPVIVVSSIEHESVLETARDLERSGIELRYWPVDQKGLIDLVRASSLLDDRVLMVSVMYANNEFGTIEPIPALAKIIRERSPKALFHVDAVQALQFLNCRPRDIGADLMTFSAHKIYGPKGIGILYVRSGTKLRPIITGAGQEFGLRSGTTDVPLIVGLAKALELVLKNRESETKRMGDLKQYFFRELKKLCPKVERNGGEPSLPNILNIYFPGYVAHDLLIKFDLQGLATSSGPACRSRSSEPSYVSRALGYSPERARGSIRFSFGRPTTRQEIDKALAIIKNCLH